MATVKRKGHLNVKRVVITALVFILIIAGIVTLICINKNKKGKNSENTNEPSVNRNDYIKDGEYIKITTDDCSLYVGTTLTLSIEGSEWHGSRNYNGNLGIADRFGCYCRHRQRDGY